MAPKPRVRFGLRFACWLLSASLLGVVYLPGCAAGRGTVASGVAPSHVLPAPVLAAAARQGCVVPRPEPGDIDRHTATVLPFIAYRAAVLRERRQDWIVACDRRMPEPVRVILVYPSDLTASTPPLGEFRLEGWRPGDEDGCERMIGIADPGWIGAILQDERLERTTGARLHASERGRPRLAGIRADRCEGDGGTIHYWTGERWIQLPTLTYSADRSGAI